MGGMTGQVDQDVDSVSANALGETLVRQPDRVMPASARLPYALRNRIGNEVRGVGDHFDPVRLIGRQCLQDAFDEKPDRMAA